MASFGSYQLVAFAPTRDAARAKTFYGETLGLRLVSEDNFALVFDAHGTTLRVNIVGEFQPHPFTILGWQVSNIVKTAKDLQGAGVVLERFKGLPQDETGIWAAPGGTKVGWFKDPDGNILSISQE